MARTDAESLASRVPAMLDFMRDHGPAQLAQATAALREVELSEWRRLVDACWNGDAPDAGDPITFVVEALVQPSAEATALRRSADDKESSLDPPATAAPARCPICDGAPVVGVLRASGQSARRTLVCGLCFHEWAWPRISCPACGEQVFEKQAVYRAEEFALIRVDACETCRAYIKTVDLSIDARAVPVVDEMAGVPLDLWAREQGYTKIRPNLLRM